MHGLVILALSYLFRRTSKAKQAPPTAKGTVTQPIPTLELLRADAEEKSALEDQVNALYGLEGTDMDQVRLSDILRVIECVVLSNIVRGVTFGCFTRWEEPIASDIEIPIDVVEETAYLVARAGIGTDDWTRVRWVVESGMLRVDIKTGEVVDTSPIPLNAPREFTVRASKALPAPVDAVRAKADLSDGILTVRLPRA